MTVENTTFAAPGQKPAPRVVLGRYRLIRRLARGGMASVYRAFDPILGRQVAVKILYAEQHGRNGQNFIARFAKEASIGAQLHHPHSVQIFDYGHEKSDGACVMVMELLQGQSLAALLRAEGVLAPSRAIRMVLQVAHAVAMAHAHGAVHRDLKPGNIFCLESPSPLTLGESQDFCKVLDFGLTRAIGLPDEGVTRTGQTLGTPHYMAPEQIRGGEIDGRVDVYALGSVLFEMVTGAPPYVRSSPWATMMAHVEAPTPTLPPQCTRPESQWLWQHLSGVLQRALAKNPADRFESMAAFALSLEQALTLSVEASRQKLPRETASRDPKDWQIVSAPEAWVGHTPPTAEALWPGGQASWSDAPTWLGELRDLAIAEPVSLKHNASGPETLVGESLWQPQTLAAPSAFAARVSRSYQKQPPTKRWLRWGVALTLMCLTLEHASQPVAAAQIWLHSEPPGAQVFWQGQKICSATPCTWHWKKRSRPAYLSLHFTHAEHEDFVATRPWSRWQTKSTVLLRPPREKGPTEPR